MAKVSLPVLQGSLRPDGRRSFLHPADVRGRFDTGRKIVFAVLIAIYAALPWIDVGGRPAVFLDVPARRFYLFGATFNAQDLWVVTFLLLVGALGLVLVTAVAGRVWCGWACPQTVFLEGVYRRVERWIQGPREKRLRRAQGPWTFDRAWRALVTQLLFLLISFVLAHVFLSYFTSYQGLFAMMSQAPGANEAAFVTVMVMTLLLYGNFAWFREQMCLVVCPYGRLQSVLLDEGSLIVGYDEQRGEPRGKRGVEGAGDCVDCKRCVVVCPTGIDIRNGLQLECLACTACVDACDEIMDRLDRPRGLVRYAARGGLEGRPQRLLRPRLVLMVGLFVGALGALGWAARTRTDFEANVLRLQGAPYVLEGDELRNAFQIHLVNKRSTRATFVITPEPVEGVRFLVPLAQVTLDSLASAHAPVFVTLPRAAWHGSFPVHLTIRVSVEGASRASEPPEARELTLGLLGP